MPKYVPEIRISAADHVRREYESHSECGMSDVATDCEVLEASYSKKPKASKAKQESLDDGVLSTDIDGSSDDEKETVVRYPIDCINSILDLGMSCEEVSNSQGPQKRQKSITCSLERAKPRTLNHERFDDGGTDVEGMYMSEDEEEYKIDSDVDLTQFEPQAYVSVSDKIVTGTIVSPRVTPEPGAERKKRTSTLRSPVPISSVLTDTEMIISDTESNTTRSKKMTKVRPFKTFFDGFTSDTDDSDASEHIPKSNVRQNKKLSCSRSFDTFNKVSVIKNNMLAPIRKKGSDCEQSLTDTEHIYFDDRVHKNEKKSESRPSVIKVNQSALNQSGSTLRYRQNVAKSKPNQVTHSQVNTTCRYQDKPKKQAGYDLNVPMPEDAGNATDIEAFGSDSDSQVDDIKPVSYLPNPRCEMVIDNESHKGKMSIILPIMNSQKNKTLKVEDLDCGYSDVEDLPDYEPEEYFRYPTPDVPRHTYMTEHSLVENKETVIDQSKLSVKNSKPDPLTDTEDLDLPVKDQPVKSQLKVRIPPRSRKVSECHTDVEDLDGSDHENRKQSLLVEDPDAVVLTDVGDLSSDDSDDDSYRFTSVTPDLELNNTYTSAMEAMSPFSFEVKKRMNESIPKIRTISPSPIPRNHTDTEDFIASQESAGSNWDYSDDGQIEPHSSVVHIRHTRKFNDRAEREHIKGFISRPDPITDVEELTMLEALEELNRKKRKHQKMKDQNEGTVRTCYSGPKGPKTNSRGHKSSGKHDNSKGAGKSKEAVDSSWLSQHEGESVEGGSQEGDLRSPYDNIGGIYYKEMADQSVYPPHLGYSEFESDILGSNSSLAPGTDTFSELLFSSSNSESEEPDDSSLLTKEQETCGILYDMSSHINKVPELLAKKAKAQIEEEVHRDSSEESLESRLKYYHELCSRSLSPQIHGVSSAERAELQELEESISQMLIDIRREECLFYNESQEEATNTIKRRPKTSHIEEERYLKINNDGETALKEIESHITKLLQDVEKEEIEVMGSLRRDFRRSMEHLSEGGWENLKKSSEKLKEDEDTWGDFKRSLDKLESTWDMINATCDLEEAQVHYVPFRDSSYTPSPVESSSTSEDEYEMVPKVQLNIGSRLGRSTIDISVQNSPNPKRKTRMTAARRSLNRSLPSLKPSSMSVIWKDHNSTECLLEPPWQPPVWQTSSIEYISPPDHIDPDSGYCIWSYTDEEPYGKDAGKDPNAKDDKESSDDNDLKETTTEMKIKDKETSKMAKSGKPKTEETSALKKDPEKQALPEKNIEHMKKVILKQKSLSPEKEMQKKKSPSPEKEIRKKKSPSPEKEILKKKSPSPEKEIQKKKSPSLDKKVTLTGQVATGKPPFGFKKPSEEKSDKDTSKSNLGESEENCTTKTGMKEEKQQDIEEKITKKSVASSKSPSPEKKIGLLGKTLETIKKPFQDKGEDKGQKEDKGKGKGRSKGKDKSTDLSKSKEGSFDIPQKPEELETKPTSSSGEIQQEISGKDSFQAQRATQADHITATSLEGKYDVERPTGSSAKAMNQGTQIETQENITQKEITAEPQSVVPETSARVEEKRGTIPVSKEEAKGKGKGKGKSGTPKSQKSIEKDVAREIIAGVKDAAKVTEKPLQEMSQLAAGRGIQEDKSDKKLITQAVDTTEEKAEQVEVSGEVTTKKSQEVKEGSPALNRKGKGKDKQGLSTEGKTQKLGANLVGKAVDVIKKPFQDQSKKNAELKNTQKGGKGKTKKSIESAKSSSEEKDSEAAQSSTKFIEMEQFIEKETIPVGELKSDETKVTQKGKEKDIIGKGKAKQASPEKPRIVLHEKAKSKSPEKPTPTAPEKTKGTSPETLSKADPKSTKDQIKPEAPKEEKFETESPTKEGKKKGKGKNKQKSPPESPIKEKKEDIKSTKQGKKQALEKQPTIEKAVEIVTRSFIDQPEDLKLEEQLKDKEHITSRTETLIKELSKEESGQEIEGKSIDLVTKPFGYSVTQEEKYKTKADKLIKELSIEKSGEIIEKGAIDLVAKPLQDLKSTGPQKMKDTQKTQKDEFGHIQKTLDDAKFKLDQFKGILSDKTSKQSIQLNENPIATRHEDKEGISTLDTQEVDIAFEKEGDLIKIQKSIEQSFKLKPSGIATTETFMEPPRVSLEFGATEIAAVGAVDSVVKEAEKITAFNIEEQKEFHRSEKKVITESDKKSDGTIICPEENITTSSNPLHEFPAVISPSETTKGIMRSMDESTPRVGKGKQEKDNDIHESSLKGFDELKGQVTATVTEIGTTTSQSIVTNTADTISSIMAPSDSEVVMTETVKQTSGDGITITEKTVKSSSQPIITGGTKGEKETDSVVSQALGSMSEALNDLEKEVAGKADTLKLNSQNSVEGTKNFKNEIDEAIGSVSPHSSIQETLGISKKIITETTERITDDGNTVTNKVVETTSEPFEGGNVFVERTTSETKHIAADIVHAVRDFGKGMMGKSNGKKGKSKNKIEAAQQAVVSKADVKTRDMETFTVLPKGLPKATNKKSEDFPESVSGTFEAQKTTVTETVQSTDNGMITIRKTLETSSTPVKETVQKITTSPKDIVGEVGESMHSFGKDVMGKIGGKKGKGKNKTEVAKQAVLNTADNVASEALGTIAKPSQHTTTSVDQTLVDSTVSVQETLVAEETKVPRTTKMSTVTSNERAIETEPIPTQDIDEKSTYKETRSSGVSEAIKGFGKDAMGKLSGEKAKGKHKMEASKQKLETVVGKLNSDVGTVAESVQNMIKITGQKVTDSTASVGDIAANTKMVGSQQIAELKDEGVTITEKTVETTSKPAKGGAQKMTTVTREIIEDAEHGAQKLFPGLVEKAEGFKEKSLDEFEDVKHSATDKTMVTIDNVKADTEATERQAMGTQHSANTLGAGQMMITQNIQKITDDGKSTIQETTRMVTAIPGESNKLIEKTNTIAKGIEGDAGQMFTKVSASETFHPELHAQTSDVAVFETLETNSLEDKTSSAASSTDEIGRIIKEMESQLLKTKFVVDEIATEESSEMESDDFVRECRTMPPTPMLTRKGFSHDVDDGSDMEGEDSKPVVTTPTLSRRVTGLGGSQRLLPAERPVVRVITEYVGDHHESDPEDDTTYTVLEPEVRERRKFKIRFSPDMYGSEEKDDADIVKVEETEEISSQAKQDNKKAEKNIKHMEKKFERMTSQTKEADPSMTEATNSEFQRIVSQLSLEDMDQALHQWDMGGLTPSEVDSKDLTLSSEDTTSPLQQGLSDIFRPKLSSILPTPIYMEKTGPEVGSSNTPESSKMKLSLVKESVPTIFQSVETDSNIREGSHTLEPGETGETPPIPSPRTPLRPTDSQETSQDASLDQTDKHLTDIKDDDSKNYASRKMFWEQLSSGSTETPPTATDVPPPVPKPRARSSISQSIDIPEEKMAGSHSEASTAEASDIGNLQDLQGITTTDSVVRGLTKERTFSVDGDTNSEVEFLRTHNKEDVSYDNDAFDYDTPQNSPFPEPRQRKTIFERSVSLPGDSTIDSASSVRAKKKIFEAQIKKEMVVEQLISQMEEEGSPERKSFDLKDQEPADQAAMLNRQIHSEIVSHELEEQIESHLLENKALVERKVEKLCDEKDTNEVTPTKTEDETNESDKTSSDVQSIYETNITSTIAEVLHYKTEAISKPSDSLEVHVDKSELEDTEKVKEMDEELKVTEEKYEGHQPHASDQTKVSSITSSQGESEDTFSESDVTPEDARFREQQDIHVWGPTEKDTKLGIDKAEEQKRQRSVHTPEEHIPDTVWEVPVQESLETVETETVGQLPSLQTNDGTLTENQAQKIAEIFVEEMENQIKTDGVPQHTGTTKITLPEKTEAPKRSEQTLKLFRTDTTTSSVEITDEDLRSSGMTDNSPLESQIGQIGTGDRADVFGEDSGDDVDAQELDKEAIGKDVVDKALAEVKQSLEAAKEELIEEKKKKRDSITKESPSEFEFKSMVLEKSFTESIEEHHHEEAIILGSKTFKEVKDTIESKAQTSEILESFITSESMSRADVLERYTSEKSIDRVLEHGGVAETEQTILTSTESSENERVVSMESQEQHIIKSKVDTQNSKIPLSTAGSGVSVDSSSSKDTTIERESLVKPAEDIFVTHVGVPRSMNDSDLANEVLAESEERKSPTEDVFSTSSSSDYKGGSNEASTLDKPSIVIRKHKKSSFKDPKSDGEMYSSSGSHYESFEQTSESIKSPGSRPLSSDIEGLVPNITGMTTGSSEYESAMSHEISGQSTNITSKEYQTAVSSLSSRDSMKSLDSESSGNLASIEVSSEASETLVPSAMELEKDSEEPVMKHSQIPPIQTEDQIKMQSFSESIEQSVSFDISEEISEDDEGMQVQAEVAARMKRSHEMTFQPEPRPIVLDEESIQTLNTSLDDMSSLVSSTTDTGAMRTVRELSKTESERMDGSATSEQLSLTVSATSDVMSLSDSKELEDTTVISKVETIATQSLPTQQSSGTIQSVTITTSSIVEHGIQSVCTQVTSKVDSQDTSHSNGPTQVDYNAEYDEGDHEVKKRGHRRNGSTSFRPSMIPVFHGREMKKKPEEIVEDSAESDKYTQPLTVKEGSQEEKKDVDETEKLDEESYKTEADQAMNRDLREGRISIGDCGAQSISMDSTSIGSKSRLPSTAFSEADSEIAELLKQCSSDIPSEDPIERPKTPEPIEECELKDDTPEFSSEAQASVTELEMEYSGAFSRTAEYATHVSPLREKELPAQESWEHIGSEQADESFVHSPDPLHLGFDDVTSEKHELETQEVMTKEKPIDRSKSPVPDITVTHHHPASCPTPQDSFEKIEMEPESGDPYSSKSQEPETEIKVEANSTGSEKETKKDDDAASESPTSDSFELLEKPDLADEFVIIEEVGKEASEQDTEGKSVRIDRKRVTPRPPTSSAPPPPPIESPPTTITKMTQIKYFSSGATEEEIPFDFDSGSPAKSSKSEKESSQEGSPPSADEPEFKPEVEASKKWMEMQFQGEPVAQIYGYDMEYERGPLEDIKEEDINELEGSMNSKIGSMGSQVSQSIGSYGSVNSSTPDYDVLAGRKYFTRSGEHDDISMNSLQEFERLEHLLAMESGKHSKSLGSQDSLTSSSNSRKHGSRSGGDDISLASLKEFEGLESACIAAERIETKAKEEETLLSEIEEGHESQASESESCVTISAVQRGESDEDDYERRMFEIDEIIRQAQTNVEQFMDSKSREMLDGGLKSETLGRADSLEEISKVPELDLDQPIVSYSSGKSYIQQWDDLGDDLITSTDSLELKTQKSKTSVMDPFTTSTDSLEVKISQDVMSVSTDSIEAVQKAKKKDIMTDSIEIGERSSMITSADSLEGKITQANSIDDDELHATGIYDQSSSSGKEGDFSSSGKEDSAEGAVGLTNRMPPPRAEYLLGSTDSLEPTSSTATHATYQYETDSVMSSSFTSGDSTTMVDDNEEGAARASIWFDEGKPYVTEVIEPIIGDDEFSHVVHRKVEMPPEIHKVSFKGLEAEAALREYIEKFDPGEDCTETREVDEHGNVHVKRVIQKRVILRPDELGGNTTDLSGPELEKYLQTITQSKLETDPPLETIHTESHSHVTTLRTSTTALSKGESIKTEQEQNQTVEPTRRGSRPPLKYDISVDEEPEFDPREHDWRFNLPTHLEREEEMQDGATGYTESRAKGSKQEKASKK